MCVTCSAGDVGRCAFICEAGIVVTVRQRSSTLWRRFPAVAERDMSMKVDWTWTPISWPLLSADFTSMGFCHVGTSEGASLRNHLQDCRRSPYEISGSCDKGGCQSIEARSGDILRRTDVYLEMDCSRFEQLQPRGTRGLVYLIFVLHLLMVTCTSKQNVIGHICIFSAYLITRTHIIESLCVNFFSRFRPMLVVFTHL
jgi:hypothetical protein